jgi:hypothetical protein
LTLPSNPARLVRSCGGLWATAGRAYTNLKKNTAGSFIHKLPFKFFLERQLRFALFAHPAWFDKTAGIGE